VIAQTRITPMKITLAFGPVTKGNATKHAHEIAVSTPIHGPSRPKTCAIRSAATPIAVSVMVNTAWSIIRMKMTAEGAIPTPVASFGRKIT
jgi:hypothetical protein